MRNEAFYKLKLIDHLYTTKLFNEKSVIASEVPIDSFKRRADIILLDDNIHLFEIKSDIDSLARLEGQLETYTSFADQVTILCSPCHAEQVQNRVSSSVGIWVLDENDKVTIIRESKYKKIRRKSLLLKHLNVIELRKTISQEGVRIKGSSNTRAEMIALTRKIKLETLRIHVMNHLKFRYSEYSGCLFSELREGAKIVESNLLLLNRRRESLDIERLTDSKASSKDLFLTRMKKSQNDSLFGPVPIHIKKYITN